MQYTLNYLVLIAVHVYPVYVYMYMPFAYGTLLFMFY